jgi:pyrroloquinoline quinone biosynthesis protein E
MKPLPAARYQSSDRNAIPPPIAMLAELTHRCPLACPYCSNPFELTQAKDELSTAEWIDAFRQAADLGVLHLHLSGGEPASRRDLVELTAAAASLGLYTNLITSGIGLTRDRIESLADAGLDHVQLSIQGATPGQSDLIGGYRGGFERKIKVADWTRDVGLPLTVNAVCHRQNMDDLENMISLAVQLGARRLEVATVQFHGWADRNKQALMPSASQVAFANALVKRMREELEGMLVIDYVPADYHARYPKACMGGWGKTGLNITPAGFVLPCHAAETIPNLTFDNVREKSLVEIWYDGSAFNAYRGEDWMQEPCRSCARKKIDHGGCRCQAMAIAGDASATDPVCVFSPLRPEIDKWTAGPMDIEVPQFVYRGR